MVKKLIIATFLLLTLSSQVSLDSLSFEREPYLQRVSDSVAILRFRTNITTSSEVRYGTDLNNLNLISSRNASTEHRHALTGLTANTKYFYQVIAPSSELTAADANYFFKTNPIPGSVSATRLWVIGDSGRANQDAVTVKNGYLSFAASTGKNADLWLMLGDNAYNNGLDSEFTNGLFKIYPDVLRNTVLWPTLGNHDGYAKKFVAGEIPYYSAFSLPRNAEVGGVPSGTESYYSFNYANIHFICLNSYDENRSSGAQMAEWLRADLAEDRSTWRIAYWHHPPYSKGKHDSDSESELVEMREEILPILENAGVDLVLSGHSHSYERSFLLNGHYGHSSSLTNEMILDDSDNSYQKPPQTTGNFGAVYVVNGVAAKVTDGSLNHPVMAHSLKNLGSMIIDINDQLLESKMISETGEVLDSFQIDKTPQVKFSSRRQNISGQIIGKADKLRAIDNQSQSLIFTDRSQQNSHKTIYTFDVPKSFYEAKLVLRGQKSRADQQHYKIYFATDDSSFSQLGIIKNYKRGKTRRFALGQIAGKKLRVKLVSTNYKNLENSGELKLDYLVLKN